MSDPCDIARAPRRSPCGFTLVEMLLAVSIFSTIAAAVYLSFSTGLEAQSRIRTASDELQRARFALDLIAGDLGTPERIGAGTLVGREDALRVGVVQSLPGGGRGESVQYLVVTEDDAPPALVRRVTFGDDVLQESPLLSGVELFEISYFVSEKGGAGVWRSDWAGGGLPYAVRVRLRTLAGGAHADYSRLIPLAPSWLRPPPEAIVEGGA
jgi:prepilin-type N-terminal cleavage/methylation domain-containing protein